MYTDKDSNLISETELYSRCVAGCISNASVEGRVIDPDVYGFCEGPGHILTLPYYDFEILQCFCDQ